MVGAARCIVEDPQSGPTAFEVADIDAQGAVLRTPKTFADSDFLDVALELSNAHRVALFAQVAGNEGRGLKLRWMHMDPSEETALAELLVHWRNGEFDELQLLAENDGDDALDIFGNEIKPKAKNEGTRRITRPDMKPVNEGAQGTKAQDSRHKTVTLDMSAPAPAENKNKTVRFEATPMNNRVISEGISAAVDGNKNATRRVVRPQGQGAAAAPAASVTPDLDGDDEDDLSDFDAGTKRKTRRVVKPNAPATPAASAPAPAAKVGPAANAAPAAKIAPVAPTTNVGAPAQAKSAVDDSGAHNVVVTNTKRFQRLKGEGDPVVPSTQQLTKRQNVLSTDGKLDVGASIRNSAKTVSASELAERHDKLKVLNMSTIKSLIQDAVAEAIEQLGGALDAKEKERLLREAEDGFKDRLEAFKAEKKGMEAQAQRLKDQLDRAQELLEDEKKRTIEKDQFTVSDSGIASLEKQFERMLSKASKTGSMDSEFEANLRALVNNLLDDERDKIAEQARKAQNESIELLERKVKRLAGSLEDTEKERDAARRHANELAKSGGGGGPVQNMYDVGLSDKDENKAAKLALLKDIFAQNQEMRDHMAKTGMSIEGRKRPQMAKPLPEAGPAKPAAADEVAAKVAAKDATKATEAAKPAAVAPEPVAAPAAVSTPSIKTEEPSVETVEAVVDSPADGEMMDDPDDMPWQPGQTISAEADFEAEESAIKKIVVTEKAPPKLERKKKAPVEAPAAAAAAAAAPSTSEPAVESGESDLNLASGDDDMANPDDQPWEPPSASDAADEEDTASGVKKISIAADSEPPPLKRKK